jgi:type I restriction enzyme M protein
VQAEEFVAAHGGRRNDISVFGQEQNPTTWRLAKMNLALHGLSGDIRQANSYYEDPHDAAGVFDYVMANPPFNVDKVKKEQLAGDPRFPFGIPKPDNRKRRHSAQVRQVHDDYLRSGGSR